MESNFNVNTKYYYTTSKKLGLPVEIIKHINGFQFTLGKINYYFKGLKTPLNNNCSQDIARDKYCVNKILASAGIPVPKAARITHENFQNNQLEHTIAGLQFPLVVKPSLGSLGQDVVCNIPNLEQLKTQMTRLFLNNDCLSIEEFHGNLNSYRVLVLNQRVIGVIQRYPAHVIGDGQHTIADLIASANIKRSETSDELAPIVIDDECQIRLKQLGIDLHYIPKQHERVVLCYTCNATRGGTYEALKTKTCRKNRQLFSKIASLVNLKIVGIDVECVDINTPIEDSAGIIIELNASPSVRIHETPQFGNPNRVTQKIIRSIIYRHPFSYLYMLYKSKKPSPYMKGLIALGFFIAVFSYYHLKVFI